MTPISFNALAIEQLGSPVSLIKKTIETLGQDEVLVRVDYASINKMDPLMARANRFQLPAPMSWASTSAARSSRWEAKVGSRQAIKSSGIRVPAAVLPTTSSPRNKPSSSEELFRPRGL